MKSSRWLLAALLAAVLAVTLCATTGAAVTKGPAVESRVDPEADLSGYATYSWRRGRDLPDDGPLAPGGSFERKLHRAGDRALSAKGYYQAAGSGPDFWVVYHLIPQDRMLVEGEGYKVGRWVTLGTTETTFRSFTEGTLVIDVVDAASDELVWTGWASGLASAQKDLSRMVGRVAKAILEQLPEAE